MKKLLHDATGFAAASMVVAALAFFFAPQIENLLGPDRTMTLKTVLFAAFAIYTLTFVARLLSSTRRRKD